MKILSLETDIDLMCKVLKNREQPSIAVVYGGSDHMFNLEDIVSQDECEVVKQRGVTSTKDVDDFLNSRKKIPALLEFTDESLPFLEQHKNIKKRSGIDIDKATFVEFDVDEWLEHDWRKKQKTTLTHNTKRLLNQ